MTCVSVCLSDGSNLEIFLEMLNDGEIILVVSHDEASTKYVAALVSLCVRWCRCVARKPSFSFYILLHFL